MCLNCYTPHKCSYCTIGNIGKSFSSAAWQIKFQMVTILYWPHPWNEKYVSLLQCSTYYHKTSTKIGCFITKAIASFVTMIM